ncbi:MAG: hypothetical protein A3Q59_05525 [Methanomethylophilus alvi]|nr:MAG: hypothetical protein A3Q59_05525 [Methanomethylophilus alvi]
MNCRRLAAVIAVLAVILSGIAVQASQGSDADSGPWVLIDEGDGDTYWAAADQTQTTVGGVLRSAAESLGLEYSESGGTVTVDGMSEVTVGGSEHSETCSWRYYVWGSSGEWTDSTSASFLSEAPAASSIAPGFYPDGTVPTETPDDMASWTMIRGNSSLTKVQEGDDTSGSGPATVMSKSLGQNFVDANPLIARGCVYAVYGGYYSGDSVPTLYCFDRYTGAEKWHVSSPEGVGYETQTGAIAGNYYYWPVTNGHILKVPLSGPGTESYTVEISSVLASASSGSLTVSAVEYKLSSESSYVSAEKEERDTDVFIIPAEIGSSYDINVTSDGTVYSGTVTVDSASKGGVSVSFDGDSLKSYTDSTVTAYSDVDSVYVMKKFAAFDSSRTIEGRSTYATGVASMTVWGGALFFGTSNGYTYAMDFDLNVLWRTDTEGQNYYDCPSVSGGNVYLGNYNGQLYVLDAATGDVKASADIASYPSKVYGEGGRVCSPLAVGDLIFMSVSDGLGMNSTQGGLRVYRFGGSSLTEVLSDDSVGLSSTFMTYVDSEDGSWVYFLCDKGLCRVSADGSGGTETADSDVSGIRGSPVNVGGKYLVYQDYAFSRNGSGGIIHVVSLDGKEVGSISRPSDIDQWTMTSVLVCGSMIYIGTDGGFAVLKSDLTVGVSPGGDSGGLPGWVIWAAVACIALAALAAAAILLARRAGKPPGKYLSEKLGAMSGFRNEALSKTAANKRRLLFVLVLGTALAAAAFLCCLAFGPSHSMSLSEAAGNLISAIDKGGKGLTNDELYVYESRLPRAIAAMAVGMGLSVAGCMYQAVIRNPLVDPYIMGVSSGAGTFAVASIASGFTLWGLLGNSDFMVPVLAVIGGLLAFGLTMLIAVLAGRTSTSYVLAGVVIGLAFSSIQTVILTTSDSEDLQNAVSWLYGSFTSVDWDNVWLIFFPTVFMCAASLLWAKELNLVLLGDDNAQQMGLNVRRFDAGMLILASVLTSVCVAFVGIIGFVGMVVPHICRMILGSDHRLVLPASIVLGAAMMLLADLLARMIMIPQELPVGAITTVIGVPLFAYLLIKRGKMYSG